MNTRNQTLQNSLRCLQHPLSLVGIAVLLFNDHVLKTLYPSWLTGKLSDFAGLFFFPFLVAAAFSIFASRSNDDPNTIGLIAFLSAASWFALFKAVPIANQATNTILSTLAGYSIRLVLDPADLLALLMLWPAWKLWIQSNPDKSQKVSYAPLILGLIACMATSPAAPSVESVTHLVESNGRIFALDSIHGRVAISESDGKVWGWTEQYDFDLIPVDLKKLPITACLPNDPNECYRINGESIVEQSHDGGQSWIISWELPANRATYMNRIEPAIDLGPYDLLIVERKSQNFILVAAGEEGVLRKELPDGNWERVRVQHAAPTPIKSDNLFDASSIIWRELIAWFILSIFTFVAACWIIWSSSSKISASRLNRATWIVLPSLSSVLAILLTTFVVIVVGFTLFAVFQILEALASDNTLLDFLPLTFLFCIGSSLGVFPITIFRILRSWKSVLIRHGYSAHRAQQLVWVAFGSHITVFAIGVLIWLCWAADIISEYYAAMIFVLVTTGLIAALFLKGIETLSKQQEKTTDTGFES